MKDEGGLGAIARYLHELGALKRVRRSGWWLAGVRDPESVAEHSFRAAATAYFLAGLEGADRGKAVAMALFHDAAEARVNDPHRILKQYVDWAGVEEKVVSDQLRGLPAGPAGGLEGLLAEARARETLEARVAKDADRIECLLQAREYAEQGHKVDEWIESSAGELSTESARRLARAILASRPDGWRAAGGP
jgi:putative hydrolase of HD superfamily